MKVVYRWSVRPSSLASVLAWVSPDFLPTKSIVPGTASTSGPKARTPDIRPCVLRAIVVVITAYAVATGAGLRDWCGGGGPWVVSTHIELLLVSERGRS